MYIVHTRKLMPIALHWSCIYTYKPCGIHKHTAACNAIDIEQEQWKKQNSKEMVERPKGFYSTGYKFKLEFQHSTQMSNSR